MGVFFITGYTSTIDSVQVTEAKESPERIDAAYIYISQQQDLFHKEFIIYDDRDSGGLHFFPSGWMGDLVNLDSNLNKVIIDDACSFQPKRDLTCMRITYPSMLAQKRGCLGWIGIFSQYPDKNWGEKRGYDLSGYCYKNEDIHLIFWIRGESGSERVKFQTGGLNRSPYFNLRLPHQDSFGPLEPVHSKREGVLKLSRNWQQHSFNLTSADLSNVIGGFCWTANNDLNPQGLIFYVDEIRILFGAKGTEKRLNEPRFIRSYVPEKVGKPDRYFRNACFTYDNALALLAFIARGTDDDIRRAKLIADAFVYAQEHDRCFSDGRLRNAYTCGDLTDPEQDGKVRLPGFWSDEEGKWFEDRIFVGTDCGNLAWTIIALLSYWEKEQPSDSTYLNIANKLGKWIHNNAYSKEGFGGYTGGVEGWGRQGQKSRLWKSTEHNIDIYVAFTRLMAATKDTCWSDRADHAKKFVERMWVESDDHFWTGTMRKDDQPETLNTEVIPLDVHPWSILAFRDVKYEAGMNWAINHCWIPPSSSDSACGFDFKGCWIDSSRILPGIWWEGTAQMLATFKMLGDEEMIQKCSNALNEFAFSSETPGAILPCHPEQLATGFDWNYYRRAHLGATCWYIFAELGWNPYWSESIKPLKL